MRKNKKSDNCDQITVQIIIIIYPVLMIKSIFQNVRGIRSQGAFDRLNQFRRRYKLVFMAIAEPFCRRSTINKFTRGLGYHSARSNCNNKIWLFQDQQFDCNIIQDTKQQITCCFNNQDDIVLVTVVYVKCKRHLRETVGRPQGYFRQHRLTLVNCWGLQLYFGT